MTVQRLRLEESDSQYSEAKVLVISKPHWQSILITKIKNKLLLQQRILLHDYSVFSYRSVPFLKKDYSFRFEFHRKRKNAFFLPLRKQASTLKMDAQLI